MKIIIYMLVCILVFSTVLGTASSLNIEVKKQLVKENIGMAYTHTILGEYFTWTTCVPCKYAHTALKYIYANKTEWNKPFYYMTFVADDNTHAQQRYDELGIDTTPTVAWDSGYRKDKSATGIEEAMARYNTSIIICGNRTVADIDLSLNVTWLGACDQDPANGATDVKVEKNLTWTNTGMVINSTVLNNGVSQYNGHLHVYVTEANSTYWNDKFDNPYTFAFLDYANNVDFTLNAGATKVNSTIWIGKNHDNGKGEFFDEIKEDNTMVIASVFNHYNSDYADETTGFRLPVGKDPKKFDVYFGNTTPPPKMESNITKLIFDPPGNLLEFNTTYYWKVDIWDNENNPIYSPIWNFTTRPNNPPNTPYNPDPKNNSVGVPINTNLSWYGGDIDFDSVTFDVYFGKTNFSMEKIASNITNLTIDPVPLGNLEFNTTYYWQIFARDYYGLNASAAPLWNFKTQLNLPPNPPSEPFPENGANNVPTTGVILSWNCSDPNPGDFMRYCVYFEKDDNTPDVLIAENQTSMNHTIESNLELFATYYWKIVAWDSGGLSTTPSSQVWSFTTGINNPPTSPTITGPPKGRAKVPHNFTFQSTDPEGDDVYYYIDWGDGTNTNWFGPFPSGQEITQSHTWSEKKTFRISARAKDAFGNKSDWSYQDFISPVNKQSSQQWLKSLYLKILEILSKYSISFQLLAKLLGL